VYVLGVLYFSVYAGLWLGLQNYLFNRLRKTFLYQQGEYGVVVFTWVIATVTFWYLTCYCSLAIFGCFEGYFLLNPLLPLASFFWWLAPIFYCGTITYWVFIVMINVLLAEYLVTEKWIYFVGALGFVVFPFFVTYPEEKNFFDCSDYAYVQPTWIGKNIGASELFWMIEKKLAAVAQQYPATRCVILPESAFPYPIEDFDDQLACWSSLFLPETIIVLGCHTSKNEELYNSVVVIRDGKITQMYHKRNLVPLVERIPKLFGVHVFEDVFTSREYVFSYPQDQEDEIIGGLVLRICSEFFCNPHYLKSDVPLIILANDSWFNYSTTLQLVYQSVCLFYAKYRKSILYAGTYDVYFIS
jgi:apolipoprotein N-acyltransferase